MGPSSQDIVRSYRTLYRQALHAIQYSAPARYTLRTLIRHTYRAGSAADFSDQKIKNTLEFLNGAARERGLEHFIVKDLLHTWWWEAGGRRLGSDQSMRIVVEKKKSAQPMLQHFEITLKMLNESMGMCLPTRLISRAELPDNAPATSSSTPPATEGEELEETRTEDIQGRNSQTAYVR